MSMLSRPDIRDAPTPEFIAALRRRYPVEPEIDRLLTRKMERRGGPSHSMASLSALSESLVALLRDTVGGKFQVSDQCWLAGGRRLEAADAFYLALGRADGWTDDF